MLEIKNFNESLDKVSNIIKKYQNEINEKNILPKLSREEMHHLIDEEFPQESMKIEDLIYEIEEKVLPNCTKIGNSKFLSWIITSPSQGGILGEILTNGLNQAPFNFKAGPMATIMEELFINWMIKEFGYKDEAGGILVSGGSVSTLTALAAAREFHFPAMMESGMHSIEKTPIVYTSCKSHGSIDKAIGVLGIGKRNLRKIQVNENFQMDLDNLRQRIMQDIQEGCKPFCIIAQAGTSLTGAVDDISKISKIAKEFNLWLHVDAAYGGGSILCDSGKKLLNKINEADSISFDPHKWMFMPVECGCVLVKDRKNLFETYKMDLQKEFSYDIPIDFVDFGIQSTRANRALKLWFAIKLYGKKELAKSIENNFELALKLYYELKKIDGIEVIHKPMTAAINFYFNEKDEDEFIKFVEDEFFINTCKINSKKCIRICFNNYRATKDTVNEILIKISEFLSK